jgi:hypothetical protein
MPYKNGRTFSSTSAERKSRPAKKIAKRAAKKVAKRPARKISM